MKGTSPTFLYRSYDEEGRALYVGITDRLTTRLREHERWALWWKDVRRWTVDSYPSRWEARRAEAVAIMTECPLHNIVRPARNWADEALSTGQDPRLVVSTLLAEIARLNNLRAIAEHHRYVAAKELDQYEAVFCRSGEDEVPMNAPPVDWYPEPVELPEPEEIQRRAAAEARAAWAESDDRVAAAVASAVVYRGEQAAERSRRLLQDVTRDDAESRRLLAAVRGDEPADSPSER